MDYLTKEDLTTLNKWYLKKGFIIFLICLWPYIVPLIVAIYLQNKKDNILKKALNTSVMIMGNEDKVLNIINYDSKLEEVKQNFSEKVSNYNLKLQNLENELKEKKSKLDMNLSTNVKSLKIDIENLKQQKQDLLEEIDTLKSETIKKHFDFVDFEHISSGEYKNKLAVSRLNEEQDLKNNNLIRVSPSIINDKKFISNNTKQIIRLFNSECDSVMTKLTVKNIDSSRNKITRSFNSLNKIFETDGIEIDQKWLEIKLDQLNTLYLYEMKKNQEKEIQKAIKEQMVEEEKVRREIEKQKRKLEKDQKQFNNEITRMMKYLQSSNNDAEKELYLDKIRELEERIKDLEAEKEEVLEREANARAGYVYVISNIGSFGENVYKIGMTRRLEPMDRIKELSSASVPFEFDVHAMIFSENAPELENILHQTFRDKSVNKVNYRKEFFKVSLEEIEETVRKNFDKTVDFIKIPNATEYRQTLEIENTI